MLVPERFAHLAPVCCNLERIGNDGDGGYVVASDSLKNSRGLVSLGIASEWSFDSAFLKRQPNCVYLACDRGSGFLVHAYSAIRGLVRLERGWFRSSLSLARTALKFLQLVPPVSLSVRRKFIRKWVKAQVVDVKRDVAFGDVISSIASISGTKGVFLKMDIEGGEYEIIPEILRSEVNFPGLFCGLCIEVHDINRREADFLDKMDLLLQYFSIVHIHANNCVAVKSDFPDVIEMTFVPRLNPDIQIRNLSLPIYGLDFPNDPRLDEITLQFTPTMPQPSASRES